MTIWQGTAWSGWWDEPSGAAAGDKGPDLGRLALSMEWRI